MDATSVHYIIFAECYYCNVTGAGILQLVLRSRLLLPKGDERFGVGYHIFRVNGKSVDTCETCRATNHRKGTAKLMFSSHSFRIKSRIAYDHDTIEYKKVLYRYPDMKE